MQSRSILLLLISVFSSGAFADATIVYGSQTGDESYTSKLEIQNGKIRIDAPNESAYMIFDQSSDEFIIVNPDEKAYFLFDDATIAQLTDMQSKVMAQMEEQLANLPPAQREQMRQMMEKQMGGMFSQEQKIPETTFERTGKKEEINGYGCEVVNLKRDGVQHATLCLTDKDKLDISDRDFATLESMQAFARKMAAMSGPAAESFTEFSDPDRDEIAIRFATQQSANPSVSVLEEVDTAAIDGARFVVPSGYEKQEIPSLP